MSYLVLFCSVFFSPFSIAIFRTFVRFALVWFCLFPLLLGVSEGLRFVIVALPGLFSYLLFIRLVLFPLTRNEVIYSFVFN